MLKISAAQPPICYVNKQIRTEALAFFYRTNNFVAELAHELDVETVENWLAAIGDENVRHLRQISLSCWTMDRLETRDEGWYGYVVRCIINPKAGTHEIAVRKRTYVSSDSGPTFPADGDGAELVRQLEEGLTTLVSRDMDVEAVAKLVQGFHWLVGRY